MAVTSPDNIWTPDLGDSYAPTVDLAAMADSIQTGLNNVRGEASSAIPDAATQGNVNSGTGTSTFVAPQTLRAATWLPWSVAAGFEPSTVPVSSGTGRTLTVTLPAGRFTQPPIVTASNAGAARLTIAVINVTTTQFQVRQDNWTSATASGDTGVVWHAVQMSADSASG